MATFVCRTNHGDNPKDKPRVYFTCHPEDFTDSFERIVRDIFATHDCAVYYTQDMTESIPQENLATDLGRMNLFVVPVTMRLLTQPCRAMMVDIAYAKQEQIPILPFMMEAGLDEYYRAPERFGERQYLDPISADVTAIRYEEKLKKYLESVLISDELAKRIRAAFDAYIFLSYRKKDRCYANELMKLIHKHPECRDIAIWYDEFLTLGESFTNSIKKALKDSKLFALLVTPNLLEEPNGKPNYVMAKEYPAARRAGKAILPVEMEQTDRCRLAKKFAKIPECINPHDEEAFQKQLLATIRKVAITSNDNHPEHNFLIGLAYLEGIDVEMDRQRGLELIHSAANLELIEAMERLIHIYKDCAEGDSVQQAQYWSQRLADYYFKKCFNGNGSLVSSEMVQQFFAHYQDDYWLDAIIAFLLLVDQNICEDEVRRLYALLLQMGIEEYSLLLEAAAQMRNHKETTQLILVKRIIENALDGTDEPYGPLFWYVPEFGLYEIAVKTAWSMAGDARAAALVRDVCFIFGQFDFVTQVTSAVDGNALYRAALPQLRGVRRGLCELFYTGATDCTEGTDIYPRCFNLDEARKLAETGIGMDRAMPKLFEDELGLFGLTPQTGNPKGLVVLPYDDCVETFLAGNIHFVRGLVLLDTDNAYFDYLEFYRKNIKVLYLPENCTEYAKNYALHLTLDLSVRLPARWQNLNGAASRKSMDEHNSHMYIRKHVRIPEGSLELDGGFFMDCTSLETVIFPPAFAYPGIQECSSDMVFPELYEEPEERSACLEEACFENCVNLSGRVILPENVTEIKARAFKNCARLEEVVLPPRLGNIDGEAFYGCKNLRGKLHFENHVHIGEGAFVGCEKLTIVTFANGVAYIGSNAFERCRNLREVVFTPGIRGIGPYAFYGTGLQSLRFPKQAGFTVAEEVREAWGSYFDLTFGAGAFANCADLEEAILPDDLAVIPRACFERCKNLRTVKLPERLKKVEERAFSECSIYAVELPECVEEIEAYAFAQNTALRRVCIRKAPLKTGHRIFCGCENVKEAILPESLRYADLGLPEGCEITWVEVKTESEPQNNKQLYVRDLRRIPAGAYKDNLDLVGVTIEDAIGIDEYAFHGCGALKTVSVPGMLTQLGDWSFAKCASLEDVSFLPQIVSLGAGVFEDCVKIKEAKLNAQLKSIEAWAFSGCQELAQVTLPERVRSIGQGTFRDCKKLTLRGTLEYVTEIEESAFCNCAEISTLEIPKVEAIGENAFWHCAALSGIQIGPNLESLGSAAFAGCSSLQAIHLEETMLDRIQPDTFYGCAQLKTVRLPARMEVIEEGAFSLCFNLQELSLCADTLTELGVAVFGKCESLKKIDIHCVKQLEAFAFYGCSALEEVRLSPELLMIGEEAFCGCVSMEQIDLGSSLRCIKNRAFADCTALRSIRIPLSVTYIGDGAFQGCTALEHVEVSRNFQGDIQRIFGTVDSQIIRYIDTANTTHQHKVTKESGKIGTATEQNLDDAHRVVSSKTETIHTYTGFPAGLLRLSALKNRQNTAEQQSHARLLEELLKSFRIPGRIVRVVHGPCVTRYELQMETVVKLSRMMALETDIAQTLGVSKVRIAVTPDNHGCIGIEVPNGENGVVALRELLETDVFAKAQAKDTVVIGREIGEEAVVCEISKLPHLLLCGSAGTDITTFLHATILSLLRKASHGDVKLILTDLEKRGMTPYNGVSHLLIPVITEPQKAIAGLKWAEKEMMCRYRVMSDADARSIDAYNAIAEEKQVDRLPQIVIILDELADLMRIDGRKTEESICHIAQMGHAAGIHLLVATQCPCLDVISGLIKANLPSRIAFAVSNAVESRTILNSLGAEKLIGNGDMLFSPMGAERPLRVQGCVALDDEVEVVTNYIKNTYGICYNSAVCDAIAQIEGESQSRKVIASGSDNTNAESISDELLPKAVDLILEAGTASTSIIQRRLKLGYARAARILEEMEAKHIVGPQEGSKPRSILITKEQWVIMQQAMKGSQ